MHYHGTAELVAGGGGGGGWAGLGKARERTGQPAARHCRRAEELLSPEPPGKDKGAPSHPPKATPSAKRRHGL